MTDYMRLSSDRVDISRRTAPAIMEECPASARQESMERSSSEPSVEAKELVDTGESKQSSSSGNTTTSLSKQWVTSFGEHFGAAGALVAAASMDTSSLDSSREEKAGPETSKKKIKGSKSNESKASDSGDSTTQEMKGFITAGNRQKGSRSKTMSLEKATADFLWGTEEEANPYRDEIVRTIFGDVGAIRRDFSCAIERKILLHGRLYVTERFICFYSNLFGFEKKIKIPYSYIAYITKEYTAVFIPNAIAVITARKEYIFRSFWDRDECYDVLKQMHDMYRGVIETGPEAHIEEGHAVGRSSEVIGVSLPMTNTNNPNLTTTTNTKELDTSMATRRADNNIQLSSSVANAAADDYGHLLGEEAKDRRVAFNDKEAAAPPPRRGKSVPARTRDARNLLPGSAPVVPLVPPASTASSSASSSTNGEHMQAEESVGSLISLGNITAIGALAHELASATFEISVKDFYDHFISDDAPFSLAQFHEFQGDNDVTVTPWTQTYRTERESESARELRFKRRLRSPIGPAATRTTKMQRCRNFGERGIIINTVMTMEDIPYRDCFSIEDRWVAEPCMIGGLDGNNTQKEATRVRFEFQVVWTKTTIWKRRIETSSKSDLESYYNAYVHAATAYLNSLDLSSRHFEKVLNDDALSQATDFDEDDDTEHIPHDKSFGGDTGNAHADTAELFHSRFPKTATDLFQSVFVTNRVAWLVLLLIMLFITLIKQHIALVENSKVQQQLLAELSALRGDLACSRGQGTDASCNFQK